VPTLLNAMLRHPHIANFDLSSLEYCLSGGAALPLEVKHGFQPCAAVAWSRLRPERDLARVSCNLRRSTAGLDRLPLPATEISIRSLDDPNVEVARGEPARSASPGRR